VGLRLPSQGQDILRIGFSFFNCIQRLKKKRAILSTSTLRGGLIDNDCDVWEAFIYNGLRSFLF
jgi:hypothetical protein